MKCLVTDQGTAASETGLCNSHFARYFNRQYAREMASRCDDIDPESDFIECSENEAIECCICGN